MWASAIILSAVGRFSWTLASSPAHDSSQEFRGEGSPQYRYYQAAHTCLQLYMHGGPAYQHGVNNATGGPFRQSARDAAKPGGLHLKEELDVLFASTSSYRNGLKDANGVLGAEHKVATTGTCNA